MWTLLGPGSIPGQVAIFFDEVVILLTKCIEIMTKMQQNVGQETENNATNRNLEVLSIFGPNLFLTIVSSKFVRCEMYCKR